MHTVYRVISRDDNKVWHYRDDAGAFSLSSFMLGRRISAYMVIKSDERGDRVVPIENSNGDVHKLMELCKEA